MLRVSCVGNVKESLGAEIGSSDKILQCMNDELPHARQRYPASRPSTLTMLSPYESSSR
jgi:hypothetical protein